MKQPDSVDIGTQMDVVRHRLNVAREDLETAHLTFKAGQYRGANNRAYYSIFHTICAVLAKEGVAFKRHKDTLSYFNKNYVQPEIFPRELIRRIVKAEEIRHASDYDAFYVYCKIELPKVANGNWRMLHLQIGESCKTFARSSQERCSA